MHTDYCVRTLRHGGDLVDIERRGVCGQYSLSPAQPVKLAEYLLLHGHALKYGFDHEPSRCDCTHIDAARDPRDGCGGGLRADAALVRGCADGGGHAFEPGRHGRRLRVDQHHFVSAAGQTHGNATTHGAGADDGDRVHIRQVLAGLGARWPLSKEQVAQSARFQRHTAFLKATPRKSQSGVEGLLESGLHALDDMTRGHLTCAPTRELLTLPGVDRTVLRHGLELDVAEPAGALAFRQQFPEIVHCCALKISTTELPVNDAELQRTGRIDRLATQHHVERHFSSYQAREALGAAGTGEQCELDLRKSKAGLLCRTPVMAGQSKLKAAT